MKLQKTLTDGIILAEVGKRLALMRIGLSLTQGDLALRAGIAKRTLERIEAGRPVQTSNLIRIFKELGLLETLDSLLPETGPRPYDLLKLKGKSRKRVSPSSVGEKQEKKWTWGDES